MGSVEVSAGDTIRLKVTHSELNIMFEVLGVDANPAQQEGGEVEKETASEVGNKISGASLSPANALREQPARLTQSKSRFFHAPLVAYTTCELTVDITFITIPCSVGFDFFCFFFVEGFGDHTQGQTPILSFSCRARRSCLVSNSIGRTDRTLKNPSPCLNA